MTEGFEPDDPRHGTKRLYGKGCRCDRCKAAKRVHDRATRDRKRAAAQRDPSIIPHGTPNGYGKFGCRCEECVSAQSAYLANYRKSNPDRFRQYNRKYREARGFTVNEGRFSDAALRRSKLEQWRETGDASLIPHGMYGYSVGCRCDACRAGKRRYINQWRQSATEIPHGTANGFSNYGCRCALCREANRERRDRWRREIYEAGLQFAVKDGELWTGAELEMILVRNDLTVAELAALLGRTYHAVVDARWRATTDPKWIAVVGTDGVVYLD